MSGADGAALGNLLVSDAIKGRALVFAIVRSGLHPATTTIIEKEVNSAAVLENRIMAFMITNNPSAEYYYGRVICSLHTTRLVT